MSEQETILDEDVIEHSGVPGSHNLASTGQRFLNYLVDVIAQYAITFALIFLAQSSGDSTLSSIAGLSSLFIFFLYYLIMEATTGKTLGKMATRTKVVTSEGEDITFKHAFIRSLSRIVPFEAFSAFSSDGVMWHDRWAGTRVIKAN